MQNGYLPDSLSSINACPSKPCLPELNRYSWRHKRKNNNNGNSKTNRALKLCDAGKAKWILHKYVERQERALLLQLSQGEVTKTATYNRGHICSSILLRLVMFVRASFK